MSSFFQTTPPGETHGVRASVGRQNPWRVAIAVLTAVLVVGGAVAAGVGLGTVGHYDGTVLGESSDFDAAVATAIVGGGAIFLGVVVGVCGLVLGAVSWERRH